MYQVKELDYRGYLVIITEADEYDDDEYGFGFEIFEIDKSTNKKRKYPIFESYGACEFESVDDAKTVAMEFIDDYALY
jgi:hypothetical protein